MAKPFDVTVKTLLEAGPGDWLALLGQPRSPNQVSVVDADVSTLANQADKVIRVEDDPPWLLNLEFQAAHDLSLPLRILVYNALLQKRHGIKAASVAVLLSPAANASNLTGWFLVDAPLGPSWSFGYSVVRLWQMDPKLFLTGPVTLLPYALLAKVPAEELKPTAHEVFLRFLSLPDRGLAEDLFATLFFLSGVRYDKMTLQELMKDYEKLQELPAYQAMISIGEERGEARGEARGRVDEAVLLLQKLGTKKFGLPTSEQLNRLRSLALQQLEAAAERVLTARDWNEFLNHGS